MSGHTHRIALITDTTCDIPPDLTAKHHIVTVPLYIVWGQEELRDVVDIDNAAFYARLPTDPVHPKTSQPTPADFVRVIEESGAQEVVIITVSKELSGTYDSARTAQGMVDLPVHVVDSFSVSMGLGWQVLAAARARDRGGDAGAVIAAAGRVREALSVLFTVDTLEFLHKGGRIGGAARMLGTALQLKPLLAINSVTGRVDAVERTRTHQKAVRRLIAATFERVDPGRPLRVAVIHAAAHDAARALLDKVQAACSPLEITIGQISPILGVHVGPGTLGLCAYNE